MKRRTFLGALGAGAAAIAANTAAGAQANIAGQRKNIVFILSDDHRYDAMSCMGHPFVETPYLDSIAKNGALLENAFVTTSLCSPSRASILTSQYAHIHRVVDNATLMPAGTPMFQEHLQDAGYETAFVGKWHMGGSTDAPRRGFDHWVSFRGQGNYYPPANGQHMLNVNGEAVPQKGYITDEITDYAVDWLTSRDKEKPFFLYFSHKAVHGAFEPAKRHLNKYANEPFPEPATMANTEENYRDKPMWVKNQRNSWHGVDYLYHHNDGEDIADLYRRYCECILALDDSVGRVLHTLKNLGVHDDTLVIYMGDNGFMWGEHGLIDKRAAYEASIRVPMLAQCPNLIEAGTRVPGIAANIDIGPTILEFAGAKPLDDINGQSFLPLLTGAKESSRDELFYEYFWEYSFPQTPTMHAIRTDKYKLIRYYGIWDLNELYDMEDDPDETTNLINSPEHQDIVKELTNRLEQELIKTDGLEIPFTVIRNSQNLRTKSGSVAAEFPEVFLRE